MRIGIIISGPPSSGKSETIDHLIENHAQQEEINVRKGFHVLALDYRLPSLKLVVNCVPSSPTKSNMKLSHRFEDSGPPEVILVPQQVGGKLFDNTLDYLKQHEYELFMYDLSNKLGAGIWDLALEEQLEDRLVQRAEEILADLKKYIVREVMS